MTGCRAFSRQFVKTYPVLSQGFEIETEMTIHAVDKNMAIENVVIEYRDRPEGSVSKLNTYKDGVRVLGTIFRLFKNYKPLYFFSALAAVLMGIAFLLFMPILLLFLKIGTVPRFPTLIISGFMALTGIVSLFTGFILSSMADKDRRDFEFKLMCVNQDKERLTR
jgi:hypothetical protein